MLLWTSVSVIAALPLREDYNIDFAMKVFGYGAAWAIGFDLLHRSVPYLCRNHDWWKRLPDTQSKYEARAVSLNQNCVSRLTALASLLHALSVGSVK